jgi:hypothetical protein
MVYAGKTPPSLIKYGVEIKGVHFFVVILELVNIPMPKLLGKPQKEEFITGRKCHAFFLN